MSFHDTKWVAGACPVVANRCDYVAEGANSVMGDPLTLIPIAHAKRVLQEALDPRREDALTMIADQDAAVAQQMREAVPGVQPAQVLQALFPRSTCTPTLRRSAGDAPSTSRRSARRSTANSWSVSDGSALS